MGVPERELQIQSLRDRVKEACEGRALRPQLPKLASVTDQIESRWRIQKKLGEAWNGVSMLKIAFQALRLRANAQQAHKLLKKACRQRKRERILAGLERVEQAAKTGDSKSFFGFARLVSPKPFLPKIKLRDPGGGMLTRFQEGEMLKEYTAQLFDGPAYSLPPLLPLPEERFTEQAWAWALTQQKQGKAVPRGMAQIRTWRDWASSVAVELAAICKQTLCSDNPYVPELWLRVQIAWLPKPGKSPSAPCNLRSVGLMSGDTKAFMILLKSWTLPFVMPALKNSSQFAYRTGCSTIDAILRASSHCREVRKHLESTSTSHLSKVLGEEQPELIGGLMVSLDLSKAFDSLPFSEIEASLRDTGMPVSLVNILMHVHAKSVCMIEHGGYSAAVSMRRGLRQGCPVAPFVYAAWTARLCKVLNDCIHATWTQEALTIYADDKFLCWRVRSVKDIKRAVCEVKIILDTLEGMGMQISFAKSEAVLVVKGKEAGAIMKKYVCPRDGLDCLRIDRAKGAAYISLKPEILYFGVVLSYAGFELQSAKRRCKLAKAEFGNLRQVLRSNSALSLPERMRIYRACVWPIIEYGILGVGLDSRSLGFISSAVCTQLRKIFRMYQKGVSNQDVYTRSGLNPAELLLDRAHSNLQRREQSDAPLCELGLQRLRQVVSNLERLGADSQGILTAHTQASEISCPVCGVYFGSEAGLAMVHEGAKVRYLKSEHSMFGIPMCKFCLQMQCDWQSLEKHITMGGCSCVKSALAQGTGIDALTEQMDKAHAANPPQPPEAIAHTLSQKVLLKDEGVMYKANNSELQQHLEAIHAVRFKCILCGQVMLQGSRIKTHWRASHPTAWSIAAQDAIYESQSLTSIFFQEAVSILRQPGQMHESSCWAVCRAVSGPGWQTFDAEGANFRGLQ